MRKLLFILGITAFAAGLSPGAFGLDVPLKFEKPSSNQDMTFPYGYGGYAMATAEKPAGEWKLPAFTTDKPYYLLLSLGDKQQILVFDKKNAEDKQYTRLWIDCNGNGDLTDEKSFDGTAQNIADASNDYFDAQFPSIDISVTVDGVKLPYCIQPRLYGYTVSGNIQINFSFTVMCGYTGTFKAGNSQYTMRIGDYNGNARFGDPVKISESRMPDRRSPLNTDGDIAYISDGKAAGYYDMQTFGNLLLVNDTLFEVKLDIPKGKMILTEVKNGLSPVKLAAKPERLTLITEDKKNCLMAFKPSTDIIRIPTGKYRLLFYQMYRRTRRKTAGE